MRGDIFRAALDEFCRLVYFFVCELRIKAENNDIGLGVVQRDARLDEIAGEIIVAHKIHRFAGAAAFQKVDRHMGRNDHASLLGGIPYSAQTLQTFLFVVRGIVRKEKETFPAFFNGFGKCKSTGQQLIAEIKRTVHIHDKAGNGGKCFFYIQKCHLISYSSL